MRVIGLDVHRSVAQIAMLEGTDIVEERRLDLEHDAVVAFGRRAGCERHRGGDGLS